MKGLSRGKLILVLAISFVMLVLSGLVVGGKIRDMIEDLEGKKTELTAEYDRLKKIDDSRSDYEAQTAKFDEQYAAMTGKYPTAITQNDQILFLRNIEDTFDLRIASASYTSPELVYQFQYLPPGNEESYRLVRSTIQFPMSLSYDEWKRFIDFIGETDGCDVIESVSADYDDDTKLVNVDMNILQYAITGADRLRVENATEVEIGTDNIFSSGAVFHTEGQDMQPRLKLPEYDLYEPSADTVTDTDTEDGEKAGSEDDSDRQDTDKEDADTEAADGSENAGQTIEQDGDRENSSGIRSSIR